MDFFSINENEDANLGKYQAIKIVDIRKNEHYGYIQIFMNQPSPFTVKAKSRMA